MRLAFAVAAHLDPEILIVDEVLAVGDAQFQQKCLGKMQDVAGAMAARCCSSATTSRRSIRSARGRHGWRPVASTATGRPPKSSRPT